MNIEETIQKLHDMKLRALAAAAAAVSEMIQLPPDNQLSFEEKIGMLVEREWIDRDNRKLAQRVKQARLSHRASPEQIICDPARGLDKPTLRELTSDQWVRAHQYARKLKPNLRLQDQPRPPARARSAPAIVSGPGRLRHSEAGSGALERLSGKQAPPHADTEQSLAELQTRVRSAIEHLDSYTAKDFENAATRVISQPRWDGKVMSGADYFVEHGLPNFFFHASHTYAILRHNGVNLGKRDYLGTLSLRAQ